MYTESFISIDDIKEQIKENSLSISAGQMNIVMENVRKGAQNV